MRNVAVPHVPRLTDGVVVLDAYTDNDLDVHVAGEDEEHARRFGWHPKRSTRENVRSAFARWTQDWELGGPSRTFAVRASKSGELVGGVQLRVRNEQVAEISYWTYPAHRERGFAARATRLACTFAFADLGVQRIEAYVEPNNCPSRRVVEAAGFLEGGLMPDHELTQGGERRDMILYALQRASA
jgi:RimJ/RimL family protein N-acetyltransferase